MKKYLFVPLLLISFLTCVYASPNTAPRVTAQSGRTQAVVKVIKANVRSGPSTSTKVIGTLSQGAVVSLVAERIGPWFKVHDEATDIEGWLHGDLITLKKAETKRSIGSTIRSVRSYINVDRIRVPSPVFTNKRPAGASARCGDGSYSFSLHRQGTCSHHGGVAEWF